MATAMGFFAVAASAAADSVPPTGETRPALRVALLGTSLTKNGGWDAALERRLSACLGRSVHTFNFGGAGETSRWGMAQTERVRAIRPDVVAIEFSANDASILKGFSIAESAANAEAIIRRLRAGGREPRVLLMAMNPMRGLRGWTRPWLEQYYDAYAPLADRVDARYVDLRPAWRALGRDGLSAALPDGVHPQADVAAGLVAPALSAEIATLLGSQCR